MGLNVVRHSSPNQSSMMRMERWMESYSLIIIPWVPIFPPKTHKNGLRILGHEPTIPKYFLIWWLGPYELSCFLVQT